MDAFCVLVDDCESKYCIIFKNTEIGYIEHNTEDRINRNMKRIYFFKKPSSNKHRPILCKGKLKNKNIKQEAVWKKNQTKHL